MGADVVQPHGDAVGQALAFWRKVLRAGGPTRLPPWTSHPRPGSGTCEVTVSAEQVATLRGLSEALELPFSSLILTAHAKVLGALAGEPTVTIGYADGAGPPLPLRLGTAPGTWRAMWLDTARAQAALLAHRDFLPDELMHSLGLSEPLFDTVFDTGTDDGGASIPAIVLRVACLQGKRTVLRLRYRTEVLDAEGAGRIAGYHLAALGLIAADPDALHDRQSLLSEKERHLQLYGLAGRRRALPGRRFHRLFEQRVRAQPEAVAVEHGDQQIRYRQLNARANQLARALLARGLRPEDRVAVVTERNPGWLVAVLAIFKAGGAYLPIEPAYPAERIHTMLSRADCRLVLTEHDSRTQLDQALATLPEVQPLPITTATTEGHDATDLDIDVGPDQLAYVCFTSGSTGTPKGAMCEHDGMLNHLLAKIDDLQIGEGSVVAQTARPCFDISIWQLLSALMVGGRTVLIEQAVVLDVQRFLDQLVARRVQVVQLVPSYLEVVVDQLERHARTLPDLRWVSVTGEALKRALTQRWFAVQPGIRLLNAYGLTETSDDTHHEVIDRVPQRERVPIGHPISNVQADIVDAQLSLLPLGATGEIVFSGLCVGRGYINDPERTRQAFMADPHRRGARLYRSGDFGRWLPEGSLEFLGRRDNQIKIHGMRIEIGEIENALVLLTGVRDCAVVVTGREDQGRRLVAFCAGVRPLDTQVLQDRLRERLPAHAVPSAVHGLASLPLSENGKIDRKALTALAEALATAGRALPQPPATPTEQRVASAWAEVLGIPKQQIHREDHFFALGGSSLSALKLAIQLHRAVALQDLADHPVLADLAALVDARTGGQPPAPPPDLEPSP